MKKALLFMLYSPILKVLEKENNSSKSPFGGMGMNFTSPEDLMKNLPKMFGSGGGGVDLGESPIFKLSIREYEESGLRVGDKVTIEIKKSDSSGT